MSSETNGITVKVHVTQVSKTLIELRDDTPLGLTLSHVGHKITVTSGCVYSDAVFYQLKHSIKKDVFDAWSEGFNGGLLLDAVDNKFTGILNVFVISDGTKTDVGASELAEPTLPETYTACFKIGEITVDDGNIESVSPMAGYFTTLWVS